jgi:hypothetical protein
LRTIRREATGRRREQEPRPGASDHDDRERRANPPFSTITRVFRDPLKVHCDFSGGSSFMAKPLPADELFSFTHFKRSAVDGRIVFYARFIEKATGTKAPPRASRLYSNGPSRACRLPDDLDRQHRDSEAIPVAREPRPHSQGTRGASCRPLRRSRPSAQPGPRIKNQLALKIQDAINEAFAAMNYKLWPEIWPSAGTNIQC